MRKSPLQRQMKQCGTVTVTLQSAVLGNLSVIAERSPSPSLSAPRSAAAGPAAGWGRAAPCLRRGLAAAAPPAGRRGGVGTGGSSGASPGLGSAAGPCLGGEGGAAGEAGGGSPQCGSAAGRCGGRRPGPEEGKRGRNPGRLSAAGPRGRHLGGSRGSERRPPHGAAPGSRCGNTGGSGVREQCGRRGLCGRPARRPGGSERARVGERDAGIAVLCWAGREPGGRQRWGEAPGRCVQVGGWRGLLPAGLQGGSDCGPSVLALRPVTRHSSAWTGVVSPCWGCCKCMIGGTIRRAERA